MFAEQQCTKPASRDHAAVLCLQHIVPKFGVGVPAQPHSSNGYVARMYARKKVHDDPALSRRNITKVTIQPLFTDTPVEDVTMDAAEGDPVECAD